MKEIKIYKPKALVQGYKINLAEGEYVAVPDRDYKDSQIKVIYMGKFMLIKDWHKALTYRRFHDQFGRQDSYTLAYFKWSPEENSVIKYEFDNKTKTAKVIY